MRRARIAGWAPSVCGAIGLLLLAGCGPSGDLLDFAASPTEGPAPLAVTFTPTFSRDVRTYAWDFGDGETSAERNPTHTYEQPGGYTVSLTVVPTKGSPVTATKSGIVHVTGGAASLLLFWSERGTGTISRGDPEGMHREAIVSGLISPEDLAVSGSKIYWTDYGTGKVERANLDGSAREVIASDQRSPTGIAVDPLRGKVYWTCLPSGPYDAVPSDGTIQRADLDGAGAEAIAAFSPGEAFAWQLAVDPVAGRLFWISLSWEALDSGACEGRILSAGLDASDPVPIVSGICDPTDLALDGAASSAATYLYWTSEDPGALFRARVDGAGAASLVTGISDAESVAVDPAEGKVYWTAGTLLQRASLDGTGVTTVYSDLILPEGIALDH